MAAWAHLFEAEPEWTPKCGDAVVWRKKPGTMIRKGKVLNVVGHFMLVEVEIPNWSCRQTKRVQAEKKDLRPIGATDPVVRGNTPPPAPR